MSAIVSRINTPLQGLKSSPKLLASLLMTKIVIILTLDQQDEGQNMTLSLDAETALRNT